ncbi:MAG TPA: SDR family NAD(P)-dependent oxidoreductase [Micromonosporaceae bacterium]|jgi:3-oxoacyl-[acyl-carrier protein] reductase
MRFDGRTAVVTGGAGGIGRAVAGGFAAAGAAVAVVDVAGDAVRSAVSALSGAGAGAPVRGYEVDVTDPAAVRDLMTAVATDLGGPHVLVTLAGGSLGTPRDLPAIGRADLDLVLDVNVKGTFYCCQAVAPLMAAGGGGAIVTCSSVGARQPSPVTGAPYAAAKAAVGGLTRRLARELGPRGIRVNAVAPGLFLTERLRQRFDEMAEPERREVLDAIPLGRMPELREIVDPVLFLAGDGASFITGITLDVNGGRYLPP